MNTVFHVVAKACILLAALLLISCSSLGLNQSNGIKKPIDDEKLYQHMTLSNGLKVLLISDVKSAQASASMNVDVGSAHDSIDRQGLAHFLEHMLFLGTKKHPKAGEYQNFISSHGGNHNAFTAYQDTNYFFDIDSEHINEALDRFSQFFIAPMFDEKFLEREKNAVHSEFYLKLKDDSRRIIDALKSIINPAHPFSKFSTGNLLTLASREEGGLKKEIESFYREHYSSEKMSLVLYSNKSLRQMRLMVKKYFSSIPNHSKSVGAKAGTTSLTEEELFLPDTLPSKLHIKSLNDMLVLSLLFPVPENRNNYKTNALYFLSHLLGYEGKGSLFSELKKRGWAESLSAGGGIKFDDQVLFPIDISLTKKGYEHIDDVISLFFQAVNRVKKDGIKASLYDEQKKLSRISFEFKTEGKPINLVTELAGNLRLYNAEDVIFAPYMMEVFDESLLDKTLTYFNPRNMVVKVISNQEQAETSTLWYKTPYSSKAIDEELIKQWEGVGLNPDILVPAKNKYIVEDFSIKQPSVSVDKSFEYGEPVKIVDKKNLQLWKVPGNKFNKPKANIFIRFYSKLSTKNVDNAVLNSLYAMLLNDTLNEELYDAYLTGLNVFFESHLRGLSLNVSGFNEKQESLLEAVLTQIKLDKVSTIRFDSLKNEYMLSLQNGGLVKPYMRAYTLLQSMLQQPYISNEEKIAALNRVSVTDFKKYIDTFWYDASSKALINGNVSKEQAKIISGLVEEVLPLESVKPSAIGFLKLPIVHKGSKKAKLWKISTTQNDAAYLRYIQADGVSNKDHALFLLAGQILDPLFYHQMRTEQQLGYLVSASYYANLNVPGVSFLIQSNNVSATLLDASVDVFLSKAKQYVENKLTQAEFEKRKNAVMAKLLLPSTSLDEEAIKLWSRIALARPFNFNEALAKEVQDLELAEWRTFFSAKIADPSLARALHVAAQPTVEGEGKEKAEQSLWKKNQGTYWVE